MSVVISSSIIDLAKRSPVSPNLLTYAALKFSCKSLPLVPKAFISLPLAPANNAPIPNAAVPPSPTSVANLLGSIVPSSDSCCILLYVVIAGTDAIPLAVPDTVLGATFATFCAVLVACTPLAIQPSQNKGNNK